MLQILRHRIFLLLGFLLLVLLGSAFYMMAGPRIIEEAKNHNPPDELSFSFSYCGDENAKEEIVSSTWVDTNTLRVKAVATPGCGTSWLFGDYLLNGNRLTLSYKAIMVGVLACKCGFPVEYEISPIEKADYEISLVAGEEIYNPPEFFYKLIGIEIAKP